MNIDKAREMVKTAATERKRWGKMAGFGGYHQDDVLDALVLIYEEGMLDNAPEVHKNLKEALTKAHRQSGAAVARATKYQAQIKERDARIKELESSLEASK